MKKIIFLSSLLLVGCSEESSTPPEEVQNSIVDEIVDITSTEDDSTIVENIINQHEPQATVSEYSYETFEGENGWGYQIFKGDQMMINQQHIPAIAGISGFSSEDNASITASFIIKQMDQGVFPPTISPATLDSLGVL